jgi:hypothetical protein
VGAATRLDAFFEVIWSAAIEYVAETESAFLVRCSAASPYAYFVPSISASVGFDTFELLVVGDFFGAPVGVDEELAPLSQPPTVTSSDFSL